MQKFIKSNFTISLVASTVFAFSLAAEAAQTVNLKHQPVSILNSLIHRTAVKSDNNINELSRKIDFNQTLHVRLKQTYKGYQVLGGDIILHIPKIENNKLNKPLSAITSPSTTMNGIIFQRLETDLAKNTSIFFEKTQADKAFQSITRTARKNSPITDKQIELKVFIDKNNQAHWVYLMSYKTQTEKGFPSIPTFIVDAISFQIYKKWDNVMTLETVKAGGFGGNKKTGMIAYDDLPGHLPSFMVLRDSLSKTCYLHDDIAIVRDARNDWNEVQFPCAVPVSQHNNLYWNGGSGWHPDLEEMNNPDATNGGYSQSDDAYYAAHVIKSMYLDWFHIDPAINFFTKQPMKITIFTHSGSIANAAWAMDHMVIYDGDEDSYPLSTLDVIGHEINHNFTFNHAVLMYFDQSGGLNESFSDMGAQAVEYYANGKNDWMIGADIKKEDKALRYMDQPSKDCPADTPPGGSKEEDMCSIENVSQYYDGLDVHYSSGIFNKVFYLMSTSAGWDIKKAYSVMVQANMYYWTPLINFSDAACGIVNSTNDYGYDVDTVLRALQAVGIDGSKC